MTILHQVSSLRDFVTAAQGQLRHELVTYCGDLGQVLQPLYDLY
jgi:hypothetical protein